MAMNDHIYVMREAIIKLTQMLAGRGIQVTQRGVSAYVRGDKTGRPVLVNLPYIPDNATTELIDAIQGFLDHEVAHILFTEFNTMEEAMKTGAGGMLNLIEDARIEGEMEKRFSGSAENLARMGKFFLDKYTKPKMEAAIKSGDTKTLVAVLTVPLVRAMAGQQIFAEFMKDKMHHVEEVNNKIKDLAPRIAGATSTRDCLDLANVIVSRLRDGAAAPKPADPSAPPPPPIPMPGGSGSGKKDPSAPKGAKAPKPATPPADPDEEEDPADPVDPDEEEDPAPAPADPADPADPDEEEDEDEEGEEGEPAADPSDPADPSDVHTGGDDDSDDDDAPATAADDGSGGNDETDIAHSSGISWADIDKETARDYDDSVSALITDSAAHAASTADYLIYTKENDIIEPLHIGKDYAPEMLTRLEDEVNGMVGPLQKDLERAISARSLSSWQPGHRSGRINASALSRLAVGDDRVFRRKSEVTSKDVAVELLVDMSGSMYGSKIHTAIQTAYALASVLERIGIPSEVICFTTGRAAATDPAAMAKEVAKIGRKFSRDEALYMPILKGFNERMTTEVRKRFGWLPNCNSLRNNIDGECVEIAARRVMARREKGKILIVLSDGAPHGSGETRTLGPHLQKVVENVTRAGVNVIGIGIESTEVRRFYPKSLVLNNVAELPVVVMKELRALIVK
jgi:cobaltochelatase CobT